MTDPRYAAARTRALTAQARKRPADPQRNPDARRDPRIAAADLGRVCTCGDSKIVHDLSAAGKRTRCLIATAAGPCDCRKYSDREEPPDG